MTSIRRLLLIWLAVLSGEVALAAKPVFELEIKDHLFVPDELTIPANTNDPYKREKGIL